MQSAEVIACSKVITLHNLLSRQPINVYSPHKGVINAVHINHTNKVIASCGQDGRIVLVNALKPQNQVFQTHFSTNSLKVAPVNCIMFSPSSQYIAAGSADSLVKIWDMKNHKQVFSTIKSHVGSVTSLGWIKNSGYQKVHGEILASSSGIGDIFLHSVKTGNIVETLNSKNQQSINEIKVSQSEGHCRLAAGTIGGSVMVWNVRNIDKDTNPICYYNNGKKSSITSVSFSVFNPVLLATSSVDSTMTFYDIKQKNKPVKVINCQQPLTSINFHRDGHRLVAGGMYGGLFVYDLRKPTQYKQKLMGHDTAVKYSVIIKQYQSTSSIMNLSRNSKASSVNSYSSKITSEKSIKQQDQYTIKQVKLNNFIQTPQNIQLINNKLITKTQNIYNKFDVNTNIDNKRQTNMNLENKRQTNIDNKKDNIKLSATGQQIIKNNNSNTTVLGNPNTIVFSNPNTTGLNNPNTTGFNKNNIPVSIPNNNRTGMIVDMKTTNSINSIHTNSRSKISQQSVSVIKQNKGVTSKNQVYSSYSIPNITNNSINQVNKKEEMISVQFRDMIEQRFDNFHMQLIRQFHIQQIQIKDMLSNLLIEDKKKTQKIKQLQNQIRNLKHTTY